MFSYRKSRADGSAFECIFMKVIARLKLTQGLSTDERNNIEKLTLAALAHLPTAVLYVHDLTGECGTTVSDQVQVCRYEK